MLRPEAVNVTTYPEVDRLLSNHQSAKKIQLKKEVMLDGDSEIQTVEMDSLQWQKELSFLKELNPNQAAYIGAFEEIQKEDDLLLKLKTGEKGILKSLRIRKVDEQLTELHATIHEDKDIFTHHRDVSVIFEDESISSFQIKGFQKILLKDTIRFEIVAEVQ